VIEIIYGESGTGKSTLLYEKIKDEVRNNKKVYLFVPDQFSFEAEKIIYKLLESISEEIDFEPDVSVTFFSRISQKILISCGKLRTYADDVVKSLIMKRVIKKLSGAGHLVYYKKQAKNRTFPKLMLNTIAELKSSGFSPSLLSTRVSECGERFSEALLDKINDICLIYREYDNALNMSFSDRYDDIRLAAEFARGNDFFKDCVCFFDGFDEFSGSQLEFIKSISEKAEKLTFTVTTDSLDSNNVRFLAATKLIGRLKEMSGGSILSEGLKEKYRNPELSAVVKAKDLWQEADWISSQIHELVAEGYRYRDISVAMPDKSYAQILGSAFKKYEIPAFIDIPEPLLNKSAVRFIIYTLQALSFETDDILRYLKSGFVRGTDEKKRVIKDTETDRLEQLSRQYDLKKKDWLNKFPEGIEFKDKEGNITEVYEPLRAEIIEPLKKLSKAMEEPNGAKKTAALCEFICKEMDITKTIQSFYRDRSEESGDPITYKQKQDEYCSVWDDVVEIFESVYEALKNDDISLSDYTELITDIFATTNIAHPPKYLDAVTVGDIERSRFGKTKVAFLCGVNQGVFPRSAGNTSIFTGSETEQLFENGISVGSDRASRYCGEQFKFYRIINLPEERLFVTYSALNEEIKPIYKSAYVDDLCEKFGVEERGADEFGAEFYCRTKASARRYLSSIYSARAKAEEKDALKKTIEDADYAEILRQAAKDPSERHIISEKNAQTLLKKSSYSPSAIDMLNSCKFKFFCGRGLYLSEALKRETGARIAGDVVHHCLERLLTEYFKNDDFSKEEGRKKLEALTDEELRKIIDDYIEKYNEEKLLGGFGGGERFNYQIKRLSETAFLAAKNVRLGIIEGGFIPEKFEHELDFDFGKIKIAGKCDRFDVFAKDDEKYVRVIDYKHGKDELPLKEIYNGNELQMLIYLFGLCEKLDAKPASVQYQPIGSYSMKNVSGADIAENIRQIELENAVSHAANGIIVKDTPAEDEKNKLEEYYSKTYGGTDTGYSKSAVLTKDDFESLGKYCKAYVNAIAMEASAGMISAVPKEDSACNYCDYKMICGHDKDEEDDN